jgi:cobalt-zinc-cadmium efflux system outer membrane protein
MKQASIILFVSMVSFCADLFSQHSIDTILLQIEKNNTTLAAYRKSVDADKIGNKTGLYLRNPELAFNYLWGNPAEIDNRKDFSIMQSFDFPTAYAYKNQLANIRIEQAELEYKKHQMSVLLQSRMVCIELIYLNKSKSELNKRLAHATQMALAVQKTYDLGEANILEYNKTRMNLLKISKEVERNEIERNVRLSDLASLNGGISIGFFDSVYPEQTIDSDFEHWYAQIEQENPVLLWLKQEIAVSQKQKQLTTALSFPGFEAGYMSENVVGEQFQGIALGVSIPLWENKNSIRYAKAKTVAVQSLEADTKLQFYNKMKALHDKVIALQNSMNDYQAKLHTFSNSELLRKALDMGEISLAEYFLELSLYYDSYNMLLEMEKILHSASAELNQYR